MMRSVLTILFLLLLPGCVAFHSLPPRGYAGLPEDGAQRLILDQNGDPWPPDTSAEAVLPVDLSKARAFRLADRLAKAGMPYDREAVLSAAADRLAQPDGRTVILIRGFNNSFGTFRAEYAAVRTWLGGRNPTAGQRFVDVYWDALHRGGGKAGYPLGRFVRSRGNAEKAGRCGLRDLLRRLPAGSDVTLVTHSLGIGVALAALTERPAGRGEVLCNGEPAPAAPRHLGDVRIVAFAPAIGRIHLLDPEGRVTARTLGVIDRLYVGFNPQDPAVTKRNARIDLPDWLGGDTRLGGNPRFVANVDGKLAKQGLANEFQPMSFSHPDHAMARYLADEPAARCMMWAGALLAERPQDCVLTW